jgi:hypothetical protein
MKKFWMTVLAVIVAAIVGLKVWIARASRPFDSTPISPHGA